MGDGAGDVQAASAVIWPRVAIRSDQAGVGGYPFLRITRHHDDGQLWRHCLCGFRDFDPAHAGHGEVHDHHVGDMRVDLRHGILAGRCLHHLITEHFQTFDHEAAHAFVIIDHQNT
jgi:hypothetical protein